MHNHPPIVIYEEDKTRYYDALGQFDRTGELETLTAFLKDQLEKTWDATLSRYATTRQARKLMKPRL